MQNNVNNIMSSDSSRHSSRRPHDHSAFPPPASSNTALERGISNLRINEPHNGAPSANIAPLPQVHHHTMGPGAEATGYIGNNGTWYPDSNFGNNIFPNSLSPAAQQQVRYWRTCYHHTANPRAGGTCYGGVCGPYGMNYGYSHAHLNVTTPTMPSLNTYITGPPPARAANMPSHSYMTSNPHIKPESHHTKPQRKIQRSHLPWHHKMIPKPRWNKQHPKPCWQKFKLKISDLQVGLIVYVIPNGEWSGDRPATVLSWENNRIRLLCCTSFSERDIWRKYAHFADEWVAEEHKSQYVLVSNGGRTRPHNFLPVVDLKQRMELPKTTYVDFYMNYECGIDDIIRFGDSQRSAMNTYVVDQPSMATIGWYLQVRHDLMVQTEQYEARKTYYRKVVGPDAARAAVARDIRTASQAGGEDFGSDVKGQ